MEKYLQFAKEIAKQAGKIMLEHSSFGISIEWKADASPVTIADKAINKLLIDEVDRLFPDHSVYGEEQSNIKTGSEYLWVCDPIDGTAPYTLGMPISTFSLALVKEGLPILAVVYDPFMKRLFHATKGSGCFCNDQKISVNNRSDLKSNGIYALVEGSNGDIFRGTEFRNLLIGDYGIRCPRLYSLVYSAMLVAVGAADIVVFSAKTQHDVAAVKLLVEEAGGKVTAIDGTEQRYDQEIKGALITNGKMHQITLDLLKPYLN